MLLTFQPMDEASAREILTWRYDEPYTLYNPDPAHLERDLQTYLDPANAYYSVHDAHGELVAFRCFGPDGQVPGGDYSADALDTGGGIRRDLTGRGLGLGVLTAGLEFGRRTYQPRAFRVTVATFNTRARRVCERAGFRPVRIFNSSYDGREFVVMILQE